MKTNMYKLPSISPEVIWSEYAPFIKVISNVTFDEEGRCDEEQLLNARKAFNTWYSLVLENETKPITVSFDKLVFNTARQSLMSNIMAVRCGERLATNNIICVSHKMFSMLLGNMLNNTNLLYIVDASPIRANEKVERMMHSIMKRITGAGIVVVDAAGGQTRYGFIVATPSQQKTGGLYMGRDRVMALEPVQKAWNFGRTFADFNANVSTNAVEWLKANALSATPADPTEYSLRDIIVMKAVKVKKLFKRVARVNSDGTIAHLAEGEIEQELFDGQMLWLKKVPSGQNRGWCFKAFGINGNHLISMVSGWEDIIVEDIDGNKRRLGDAVAICTDSCWKGSKFFSSYGQFCDKAEELANYIPDFDKVWVVREAGDIDEDGEEVDYGRRLSRQATQQWANATLAQLANLTRKTRDSLNRLKTFDGLVRSASEQAKPLAKRSDLAGLIEALPELTLTDAMQSWAKTRYERKQLDAAANRLHVNGNYPYIAMDPWAMVQVLVLGMDPNKENIGLLAAGEVYNKKYKDGQKLFAIRYPANYQTGTVLVNRIIDEFKELGDVAVLPMHGDTIIREDGDFDGDEMMFCPDDIVIRLTEQMIQAYKPELIDFPHGRKAEMTIWGNRSTRFDDIACALWRAMRYNQVGLYSNMAVRCTHLGKFEECILMHVMAILCLDMVKGTAVPEKLVQKAEAISASVRKELGGKMPWNQQFRDKLKKISGRKYLEASNDTVDTISRLVMTTGSYEFDFQGHELGDKWKLMTNGANAIVHNGIVPKDLAIAFVEGYSRTDMNAMDIEIYQKLVADQPIGLAELLRAASVNEAAMQYTCPGDSIADKKAAYEELVREIAFGLDCTVDKEEAKRRVVNIAANLVANRKDQKVDPMFVLRTFALDFLRNVENNTGVDHFNSFEFRRDSANSTEECDMDLSEEDLAID